MLSSLAIRSYTFLTPASSRQERNREAARQCRKRKKKQTAEMEARIQQLEQELAQTRAQLKVPTRAQISSGRNFHLTQLRQLMSSDNATDGAAAQVLLNILRVSANAIGPTLEHHVSALSELMEPFPYMKFLMWGIGCSDSFFTPDAHGRPQGLFGLLLKELKMTAEQGEKIRLMRDSFKNQARVYMLMLDSLKKLQDELRQYLAHHDRNIGELRKMLPPLSQTKFLLWAEGNDTCIELVEQMWQQATSALLAELRAPAPPPVDLGFEYHLPGL